jgi:hypothetical protein
VERAVRAGDLGALQRLDQRLAHDLLATGRPAWQVLSGAWPGLGHDAEVLYCDAPFGVGYLVAYLRPPTASIPPRAMYGPGCGTNSERSAE